MRHHRKVDAAALAQIFTEARSHRDFLDLPVSDELLREAVDIAKIGPTSCNMSPLRLLFLKSVGAKERLRPFLRSHNVDQTMAAPVVAIAATDLRFYDHLPFLMPYVNARPWFADNEKLAKEARLQSGALQVAYLILALRAVGLDTGPVSGFDSTELNAEFFPNSQYESNLLINIGYGDHAKLLPRSPRFSFEEIAKIL
ncbi:malonic semialdehyde reductase [Rhizobium rhizogenes]|uniref:malonic semialdehyde reductase n=1 Tax=Rhizobium rhizogenes TaxID=359 RepID=UPI0015746EA2|nr:malonic semialdehyde reductase [Rhizobium rhizogenes]NTI24869.1 malonic semialdehyde reductase [Rhizobium rhizogenes]QTG08589.1 malonic semialdehyde reductase [Rhizobium rhizogenes]